ncbi:hypothetical protein [Neobacillus vireti]|nr:hypothetical protein [Neobacillus vireti]
MNKRAFKENVLYLLEQDVSGLSTEKKIKFIKKWLPLEQQLSDIVCLS